MKRLINKQDRLINSGQRSNNKVLREHSKKNPNRNFKNSKPLNQGYASSNNDASKMVSNKRKVYNPFKYCGKTNHCENICFKWRHELVKANKKPSKEYQVSMCVF